MTVGMHRNPPLVLQHDPALHVHRSPLPWSIKWTFVKTKESFFPPRNELSQQIPETATSIWGPQNRAESLDRPPPSVLYAIQIVR
jgi:hypothetical protein